MIAVVLVAVGGTAGVLARYGLTVWLQSIWTVAGINLIGSFLLGLLFGDVTGSGAVIMASRHLLESAYSREAETAADDYAAHTMLALGRAPGPLGQLLRRIVGSSGDLPALLSTHPLTDQRLKALEKLVPAQPGQPLLTEEEWRSLKEICKTT